jgi:hypothetical protein
VLQVHTVGDVPVGPGIDARDLLDYLSQEGVACSWIASHLHALACEFNFAVEELWNLLGNVGVKGLLIFGKVL